MLAIIRRDPDGTIDKTLATDYNECNYTIDSLQTLCAVFALEDDDGSEYYLQTYFGPVNDYYGNLK